MALTTAAAVNDFLGTSGEDTFIETLIGRAQAAIETFCNRSFERATYTEYVDANRANTIQIKNTPVASITSVSVRATPNTWTALSSSVYDFDAASGIIEVVSPTVNLWEYAVRPGERGRNTLGNGLKSCQVVYVGGYDSTADPSEVPADLEQGCIELVGMMHAGGAGARASASTYSSVSLGYQSWTNRTVDERRSCWRTM